MVAFLCPICGRFFNDGEAIVVVAPPRRKNQLGRIAWSRDGICIKCYEKEKEAMRKNGP